MASVNSTSDRNSSEDSVRKLREAYEKKEADEAKKHGMQMKKITEAHAAELEDLKAEHTQQLDDIKSKTREYLTGRDMQYQKEIDDLRDMHQRQVQRMASEADTTRDRTEEAYKAQLGQEEKTSETQRNLLMKNFEKQEASKEQEFNQFAQQMRESQQTTNQTTKQKLALDRDKEITQLNQIHNQERAQKERQTAEILTAKDEQLHNVDHNNQVQNDRLRSEYELHIADEKETNRNNAEITREDLKHAVAENRARYDRETNEARKEASSQVESLTDSVSGRLGHQLSAMQSENRELRDSAQRERIRADREKARQIQDVSQNLGENIDKLEQARMATVDASNMRTKQMMMDVDKKNTDQLTRNNRYFLDKISTDNLQTGERFQAEKSDHERLLTQEKLSGQSRVNRLVSSSQLEQERARNYYETSTGTLRDNFESTLRDLRDRNRKDQDQIISQMTRASQDSDTKFQEKLSTLNVKYQTQMLDMQEAHQKELKEQAANAEKQRKATEKKGEVDLQVQAAQFQNKIAKLEEEHQRELDEINRRNQETLSKYGKGIKESIT